MSSDGGADQVIVTGSVERPPEILRVTADQRALYPAGSRCSPTRAEVTVAWSDESPVTATLHWQGPHEAGSGRMAAAGTEAATGHLGPFATPGSVTWRAELIDARGNRAQSAPGALPVERCA